MDEEFLTCSFFDEFLPWNLQHINDPYLGYF